MCVCVCVLKWVMSVGFFGWLNSNASARSSGCTGWHFSLCLSPPAFKSALFPSEAGGSWCCSSAIAASTFLFILCTSILGFVLGDLFSVCSLIWPIHCSPCLHKSFGSCFGLFFALMGNRGSYWRIVKSSLWMPACSGLCGDWGILGRLSLLRNLHWVQFL